MGEAQALERLRDILARPAYQVADPRPWWEQLLAPVIGLVLTAVARLVESVASAASGREGWYGLAVLGVCGVLIVVVAVYLLRAVRLSVAREARLATATRAERRARSEQLWQAAQRLGAAGEFGEAIRMLYLSALFALDEHALLHVEDSQTNREHARRLDRLHPAAAERFSAVVESYDRLRYGAGAVSPRAFAELSALVAGARAATQQRESSAPA
jgi:hypothetical protein